MIDTSEFIELDKSASWVGPSGEEVRVGISSITIPITTFKLQLGIEIGESIILKIYFNKKKKLLYFERVEHLEQGYKFSPQSMDKLKNKKAARFAITIPNAMAVQRVPRGFWSPASMEECLWKWERPISEGKITRYVGGEK